jgi:hypothetical protein
LILQAQRGVRMLTLKHVLEHMTSSDAVLQTFEAVPHLSMQQEDQMPPVVWAVIGNLLQRISRLRPQRLCLLGMVFDLSVQPAWPAGRHECPC